MKRPRLIFVTQVLDPADPVLGFTVGWIRALGERCERLVVIANEVRVVPVDLGAEVISLGKEHGAPRALRLARYLRGLQRVLSRDRPQALLAHMCPQYLNAAAPLLALYRMPGLLWFAHPRDSWTLRMAERVAAAVLTSLPGAFPFPSSKVRAIGQAIDTAGLDTVPRTEPAESLRVLALGRLSPVKGLEAIMKAVSKLVAEGVPADLRIVGPATTPVERTHAAQLSRLATDLGLDVRFDPPVPAPEVPLVLAASDVLVNGTRAGSGDKVVLEAMAARRLAVWSNPCFDVLARDLPLRLRYREDDPDDLAAVLKELWRAPHTVRLEVANSLARRVQDHHSLDEWADRVIRLVASCQRTV